MKLDSYTSRFIETFIGRNFSENYMRKLFGDFVSDAIKVLL